MTNEKLPKQELLIKLLKMTTSNSDGEALAAVRMANNLLKTAGWDWEKLINGKITIIEDPFSKTPEPKSNAPGSTWVKTPPPAKPASPPNFSTPHRPQAAPQQTWSQQQTGGPSQPFPYQTPLHAHSAPQAPKPAKAPKPAFRTPGLGSVDLKDL